jgi:L-seryl-tRNA(Ser) seleniumtransferase
MAEMSELSELYRRLPSVERLVADDRVAPLVAAQGHANVVELARGLLDEYRGEVERTGELPPVDVAEALLTRAAEAFRPSLRRVINATGVVIHTNLGRAPLSDAAIEALATAGRGYSNLEFDLEAGERGSRFSHLTATLCRVTGAEDGIAVNNNASALLLALGALCAGREVIISRGQLVEIGGGFRIPDVLRQSGATLVEVGTTNRTYARDYADAITERTAAILRVHTSNFRVVGFTEETELADLASLARDRELLLIDDVGSGALIDTRPYGLAEEPLVQASVQAGADVVLFSGDKLVGGPQAGIAAGRAETIDRMRRHPLARAMRMDKSSIAGLVATLEHFSKGEAIEQVPVWRMIAASPDELRERARRMAAAAGTRGTTTDGRSMIGGGSLPGEGLDTTLCAIDPPGSAAGFAAKLRANDPPIVARVQDGRVFLDPRTIEEESLGEVQRALGELLAGDARNGSGDAGR